MRWYWDRGELRREGTNQIVMSIGVGYDGQFGGVEPEPHDERLIVAAPDLHEALRAVRDSVDPYAHAQLNSDLIKLVDAVLAKAEGAPVDREEPKP